jgi:hypothetical protein
MLEPICFVKIWAFQVASGSKLDTSPRLMGWGVVGFSAASTRALIAAKAGMRLVPIDQDAERL